jgi:hypothetical protein
MQVRLTRRLAEYIDGIDLSRLSVGDLVNLSRHDGEMLVAEGWAVSVPAERNGDRRAHAANDSAPRKQERRP